VVTSSAVAATPIPVSISATAAGVREALFVTNASRMPVRRISASASGTLSITVAPR
jgi:hypothetical protein